MPSRGEVSGVLFREVEVDAVRLDCRVERGRIAAVGPDLVASPSDVIVAGGGGALLPGFADHHLHLRATAAAAVSLDLAGRPLHENVSPEGEGWLRVIGAGDELARTQVDLAWPDRPVRVAHRSGALWTLNTRAVEIVGDGLTGEERTSGQLWRSDERLRRLLASVGVGGEPDLAALGERMARLGITRVVDATPDQDEESIRLLAAAIPQQVTALGAALGAGSGAAAGRPPYKVVVADSDLPTLEDLTDRFASVHAAGRPVAVHVVSAVALILAITALETCGAYPGDRLEHAAVCDDRSAERLAGLGVVVVTQPTVFARHGRRFCDASPPHERSLLWRYEGLRRRGVAVAVSSDAPYGDLDPWATIHAAVTRPDREAVGVDTVLDSLLADVAGPAGPRRRIAVGEAGDVQLLTGPLASSLQQVVASGASPLRLTVLADRVFPVGDAPLSGRP